MKALAPVRSNICSQGDSVDPRSSRDCFRKPLIMFARNHQRRLNANRRKGVAAVELAVSLPFLMALAFGMLEYNNMVMLKTRMLSAAYESCRLATRPTTSEADSATAASAENVLQLPLLTQLGVNGATVTVSPSNLSSAAPQTQVTVSVTAPFGSNSLTSIVLSSSLNSTASATLIVE